MNRFLASCCPPFTGSPLGAIEYLDDASGNYKATGKSEWAIAYTPLLPEAAVFFQAVAGTDARRVMVRRPYPGNRYNGEGSGFWTAGIPTVSYISGPQWLMTAPPKGGQLSKIDNQRMYGEIVTMTRCVAQLDKMPDVAIRGPEPRKF